MATYRFSHHSLFLFFAPAIVILIGGILIIQAVVPKVDLIVRVAFLLVLLLSFFIPRIISMAVVQVTLTDETIELNWIRNFLFHHYAQKTIPLSDIESYKSQEDRTFDLFKLTLKDGSEIKFWHSNYAKSDDFDLFTLDFISRTQGHKTKRLSHRKTQEVADGLNIQREKTIYESEAAPFLAAFAIFIILFMIYLIIFDVSGRNRIMPVSVAGGAIFFLAKYFQYRRGNSKQ